MFERQLSEQLNSNELDLVPTEIQLRHFHKQGDSIDFGDHFGSILQFYSGNGFKHYVCIVDWEDWGTERCPRFSYYEAYAQDEQNSYYKLCAHVSPRFDWSLVDD